MTDINFLCTFLPETPISKHYIMGSASAIWNVFWCFLLSQIVIIKLSRRQFVNLSIRRVVIGGCLALQIPIFFSILSVHFLPLLHFLYIMHRRRTVQRRALPIDRLWSLKLKNGGTNDVTFIEGRHRLSSWQGQTFKEKSGN